MKKLYYINTYSLLIAGFSILLSLLPIKLSAYTLGIFSQSKTVQEIIDVESTMVPYRFPVVAFILDDYLRQGSLVVKNIVDKLGTGRVYHLTLSPDMLTAKQVAEGAFDEEYEAFFHDIDRYEMKVLFRTMHEMNGGRYPWSSDPINFQKARKRVYDLSRKAGLDKQNIQFIFSFNIHDMPALRGYEPSQQAKLLSCTPARKARINCPVWENYYPGDEVVDIIGITVYNRGKANSNRQRLSFRQIINDPNWNQRDRIRMVDKPIYIDEVGTTAVHYSENYSYRQSRSIFKTLKKLKSAWLSELTATLNHTPEIVGVNYFNVDYTNGLRNWIVGEADRKIVDPDEGVLYPGAQDLIDGSDPLDIRFVFEK